MRTKTRKKTRTKTKKTRTKTRKKMRTKTRKKMRLKTRTRKKTRMKTVEIIMNLTGIMKEIMKMKSNAVLLPYQDNLKCTCSV